MEPKIPPLTDWLNGREETVAKLIQLADDLNNKYNKCNKIGLLGATAGVTGAAVAGGAALLSLAAAPVAGIAVVVGGATKLGTYAADKYFSKSVLKQTQDIIDKDMDNSNLVKDTMTQLCEVEIGIYQQLAHHIKETVKCMGSEMPKIGKNRFVRSHLDGKYKVKDLAAVAGAADILKIPVVQQGLEALQKQNLESVQKLLKMCLEEYRGADRGPTYIIREIDKIAKHLGYFNLLTVQSIMRLVGYARYFGIINSASLPFQIKVLYDSATALRDGNEHEVSMAIRERVKQMNEETKEIETHIKDIVQDLSNLVLLINYIKKKGCDDSLDTIMNMILKEINKARRLTDILNDLQLHNNYEENPSSDQREAFDATTLNCEGAIGNPIKEISMWIWCAWKLKCGSIMFLQNTHFNNVPGLWTLFGVSINCFGSDNSCGVSILLPIGFDGSVESYHEFKDETDPQSSWNGRCVVANVKYKHEPFTLVNMIAPTESNERKLFITETAKHVKDHAIAPQQIIASVDFASKIPSMTVNVPKRVSSTVPLRGIMQFIPSQPVTEYLINSSHIRRRDRDTLPAQIYVDSVCDELNLTIAGSINWFHCGEPSLTYEKYADQIREFLNIGLVDLWTAKNSGFVAFSSVNEVVDRTVTATRTVHFSVSESLTDKIMFCHFDHIPRILGFAKHSPLTFAIKREDKTKGSLKIYID